MKKCVNLIGLRWTFFIACFCTVSFLYAQPRSSGNERLLTAGFQFRPIITNNFLGAGEVTARDRIFTTTIKPRLGYSFGMMIRRGITRTLSIETGINYFRRNYSVTTHDDSLNRDNRTNFGIVTYEIPVQLLIYVRLGKQFYMNNSLGLSANWYASNVASLSNDHYVSSQSYLHRVLFNPSLLANIGFEYRTEKAGFFYIGASLDRPFQYFATTVVKYDLQGGPSDYKTVNRLTAAVLTLDLRYFFHEQPIKKKTQIQKKKKEERYSGHSKQD